MNYSRILPQLVCSLLITIYFASELFGGNLLGVVWLLWPGCWLAGCVLALRKHGDGNKYVLWGSAATLGFVVLWEVSRIALALINGTLSSPDGSSLNGTLLLVWLVSALFFILPSSLFFAWNLTIVRRERMVAAGVAA